MVWFGLLYGLVWTGRFHIIWCMFIVQICYHAKSGACSFKNVRVMPILVLFGMVWFGLVMFWFGLVSILIIWCVPIVQICYHAKCGACSFKNDRVIFILVLLGLVWCCSSLLSLSSTSSPSSTLLFLISLVSLRNPLASIKSQC